ncbi:hypothetical protein C4544_02060 [candidate division WS5 bacterium]|uniref:Sulfatase N-terminal domain-containing protein n=1 Tax=candidate division WS5 bacterium TaxID=2093353 RepID=A0A419DEZ2_9BACT|nr:MAG: hypothetical protein C4544_02060 [candidate division WS5 bacterium]
MEKEKVYIIHPYLIAISPAIFIYAHNFEQVHYSLVFQAVILILCSTYVLTLTWQYIIGNNFKSGIITSTVLFVFVNYGQLVDYILSLSFSSPVFVRHRYLVLTLSLILILLVYLVIKTNNSLINLTKFLNIVMLISVMISFVHIVSKLVFEYKHRSQENIKRTATTSTDQDRKGVFPDIYYIILDGYAGYNTLKELWHYDNSDFLNYLWSKGFYVATDSRSNYGVTHLSLSSSLNMEYLDSLENKIGSEIINNKGRAYKLIENNEVMSFLKHQGYKIINFSTNWPGTMINKNADINIDCGKIPPYIRLLLQSSLIRAYTDKISFFSRKHRERILCTLSKLPETKSMIDGPRFVFAHIISPHPPWVFDKNGRQPEKGDLHFLNNDWGDEQAYLDQLIFINSKIEDVIEGILVEADVLPIIIIQSDHGPSLGKDYVKHSDKIRSVAEMNILNAYFLPDDGKKLLYNFISPVNTFRLIFNYYFHTNLNLLDDKSYWHIELGKKGLLPSDH